MRSEDLTEEQAKAMIAQIMQEAWAEAEAENDTV